MFLTYKSWSQDPPFCLGNAILYTSAFLFKPTNLRNSRIDTVKVVKKEVSVCFSYVFLISDLFSFRYSNHTCSSRNCFLHLQFLIRVSISVYNLFLRLKFCSSRLDLGHILALNYNGIDWFISIMPKIDSLSIMPKGIIDN